MTCTNVYIQPVISHWLNGSDCYICILNIYPYTEINSALPITFFLAVDRKPLQRSTTVVCSTPTETSTTKPLCLAQGMSQKRDQKGCKSQKMMEYRCLGTVTFPSWCLVTSSYFLSTWANMPCHHPHPRFDLTLSEPTSRTIGSSRFIINAAPPLLVGLCLLKLPTVKPQPPRHFGREHFGTWLWLKDVIKAEP